MNPKHLVQLILNLILTCSILAPTLVALTDVASKKVVVFDSGEEENNKEAEKKFDEKELFFEITHKNRDCHLTLTSNLKKEYLLKYQFVDFEIILPPPEASGFHFS